MHNNHKLSQWIYCTPHKNTERITQDLGSVIPIHPSSSLYTQNAISVLQQINTSFWSRIYSRAFDALPNLPMETLVNQRTQGLSAKLHWIQSRCISLLNVNFARQIIYVEHSVVFDACKCTSAKCSGNRQPTYSSSVNNIFYLYAHTRPLNPLEFSFLT